MACEMEKELKSIASMIERSEKALQKFSPGTAQHTLLKNRIDALKTAKLLLAADVQGNTAPIEKGKLESAIAPVESLISKSEKARKKLAQGSWQHTMLCGNIDALKIALPLIKKALHATQ